MTQDCFGIDCPLGVHHPRAPNPYPIGCGLCEKKPANEVIIVTPEMRRKHEENLKAIEAEKKRQEDLRKRQEE